MRRALLGMVMALVCFGCVQAQAAEEKKALEGRKLFVKLVRDAKSDPFVEPRVEAIEKLGRQVDKALINEFKVLEMLNSIAKSSGKFPRERTAALGALVSLNSAGIPSPNILKDLIDLIDVSRKSTTPLQVQLDALRLLVDLATKGKQNEVLKNRAFNSLKTLWEDASRSSNKTPVILRAQMIQALSGFVENEEVKEILLTALTREKSTMVRNGAMQGLTTYLENNPAAVDKKIQDEVTKMFARVVKKEGANDTRLLSIRCLDALASNGADFSKSKTLRENMVTLMKEGDSQEASMAVRFLIRTADKKLSVVDDIIAVAQGAGKPRDFKTEHEFSKALVEILNRIAYSNDKVNSAGKATADKIIKHFFSIITNKNKADVLKKSAIFGLGTTPTAFDRQAIVALLIKLLKAATSVQSAPDELIKEIETSLTALTGQQPFHRRIVNPAMLGPDGKPNKDAKMAALENPEKVMKEVPDVEAWERWYARYKDWLVAGKSPLEIGDKDDE